MGILAVQFEKWALQMGPFFHGFGRPFGVKKKKFENVSKKKKKHPVDRPKMHVVQGVYFGRICFSTKEKCTLQTFDLFFKMGLPHFQTVFSTICGTLKTKKIVLGAQFRFWESQNGPRAHLRISEGPYRVGGCCLCLWCCLCQCRVPWSVK